MAWTLVFHITGIVFWIGGLLMATQALSAATESAEAKVRSAQQQLAARMLRAMAHPGAIITLISGGWLLHLVGQVDAGIFHARWLIGKLIVVGALLVLDWLLWTRIRDMSARPVKRQDASMLHGLISAAFFLILILVFIRP